MLKQALWNFHLPVQVGWSSNGFAFRWLLLRTPAGILIILTEIFLGFSHPIQVNSGLLPHIMTSPHPYIEIFCRFSAYFANVELYRPIRNNRRYTVIKTLLKTRCRVYIDVDGTPFEHPTNWNRLQFLHHLRLWDPAGIRIVSRIIQVRYKFPTDSHDIVLRHVPESLKHYVPSCI